MLIFVFICKGIEEKGAIWAAVGGFFRIFLGRKGIFGGIFGPGRRLEGRFGAREGGKGRCAPGRAEARPQNQDGKTLHKMTDVGSRPNAVYLSPLGNKK